MKHTILVRNAFPKEVEQRLAEEFSIVRLAPGSEAQYSALNTIEGVATNGYLKADRAFIQLIPNLKIVATMSVGADHIDLPSARERKVVVTNIADVLNDCVADLGLGLVIAMARNIVRGDRYVRAGNWIKGPAPLGTKVGGKTLGILGLGKIGRLLAKRAEALGMKIVYCNRRPIEGTSYAYVADPVELARRADIMVVIVPATPATEKIVSGEVISALGPTGFLVNLARGSVVDDEALIRALRDQTIAGAALDVFRNEPHVRPEFLELENVLLTPHIGSATVETRIAMGMAMVDNLVAFFSGKPVPNPVA